MSSVVSPTDDFERVRLGPEAFEVLVPAGPGSRPRLPLEQELAIRSARVEERCASEMNALDVVGGALPG